MRFHSSGEGGAIISLVSEQSGSGKTTALEAVASVWGREEGIKLTDDDTRVSKGLMLGALGNLPCVYDELYNRDPEMVRQFVLMFTNGRDRMRGTADGQIRHTKATWQTILVLASNDSIVELLAQNEGTDAPAFRVLEFLTEIPKTIHRRGDELKRELRANSGYAGDAYLRYLMQPAVLEYIKQSLPKWTEQVWTKTGLQTEHRFWVRTLASIICASTIVQKLGLLDFSVQRVTDWAIEMMSAKRNDATVTGKRTSIGALTEFMHHHILDTLVMQQAWQPGGRKMPPRVEPRRNLLMRHDVDEGRVYISETHLRQWLSKHAVNRDKFMRDLKQDGVLLREQKKVTLGAGTDYATGQMFVVEIDARHPALSGILAPLVAKPPLVADIKVARQTRLDRIASYQRETK